MTMPASPPVAPSTLEPSDLEGSGGRTARRTTLLIARGLSYLVYAYVIVVEVILLMGFFLLLFGANPSAGFTEWVYRSMDRAMKPFRGIFTPIELGTPAGNEVQSIFETSVLFAMIVYGVIALVVSALITWLTARMRRIDLDEARLLQQARLQDEFQRRDEAAAISATWNQSADAAGQTPSGDASDHSTSG